MGHAIQIDFHGDKITGRGFPPAFSCLDSGKFQENEGNVLLICQ